MKTPTPTTPQPHVVLVCGGRDFAPSKHLMTYLDGYHAVRPITLLVQGGARGADRMAKTWAIASSVKQVQYDADWHQFGKAAGPERNKRMLAHAKPDVVIAFPGGAGTAHMTRIAREAGVEVIEVPPAVLTTGPAPSTTAVRE